MCDIWTFRIPVLKRAILLSIEPVSGSPTASTQTCRMEFVHCIFCIRNQKLSAYKSFYTPWRFRFLPPLLVFLILLIFFSSSFSFNLCHIPFSFIRLLDYPSVFVGLLFHVSHIIRLPPKASQCIDWCSDTLIVKRRECVKKSGVTVCSCFLKLMPLFDGNDDGKRAK